MTARILLLVLVALVTGCVAEIADPGGDEYVDYDGVPSGAALTGRHDPEGDPVSSAVFNRARQGHNTQCVNVRTWPVPLRYADFSPTGWILRPEDAVFGEGRALPRDDDTGRACRDGQIRLDVREIVSTPHGRLLFHQGGFGYAGLGDVKYGHVWIGDLADAAPAVPGPDGNGAACAPSRHPGTEGTYRVRVVPIPGEMRYRKSNYEECRGEPDVSACSISFRSYGDPAAQGDPARDPGTPHYTYMVWSWINVPQGGVVRANVPDGATFERCNVRAIQTTSIDRAGNANGWVRAVYGRVRFGDNYLYGWVPHSHVDPSGDYTAHLERVTDTPPPPPPPSAEGAATCSVRCCDQTVFQERKSSAAACRDWYGVCEDRGKVLRMRFDGDLIYVRDRECVDTATTSSSPSPPPEPTPPPPPPPPPDAGATCSVRCCDGSLFQQTIGSAAECRLWYGVCEDRGKVLRMRFDGTLIYARESACPG